MFMYIYTYVKAEKKDAKSEPIKFVGHGEQTRIQACCLLGVCK